MNEVTSGLVAVLGTLGGGGLIGFGLLAARFLRQALQATTSVQVRQEAEILRLQGLVDAKNKTIDSRNETIDDLQLQLLDAHQQLGERDLEIRRLRGTAS